MNIDKQTVKAKWLEELRSGKHHQITGTLKDQFGNGEYGYCCLGVLAEKVMGLEVRIADENILMDIGDPFVYGEVGEILGECLSAQYSDKNDGGYTFREIADYIEHNWNTGAEETVE